MTMDAEKDQHHQTSLAITDSNELNDLATALSQGKPIVARRPTLKLPISASWRTFTSLLGLHFDGVRERPRPDACVRLDADGVDGVGREVTDGGELVVLHGLTLPGLYWQGRVGGVVQLVTLRKEW